MTTTRFATILAGVAVVAAVGLAGFLARDARVAAAELADVRTQRDRAIARVGDLKTEIRRAEQRAREGERDSAELLAAVEAFRAQARAARPAADAAPERSEEERERLAQERAFQQDLARKRMAEVKRRAALEEAIRDLTPAEKFERRVALARQLAAEGELTAALALFEKAMRGKPAELPLTPDLAQLKDELEAQRGSVEVTLVSDGLTWVSIAAQKMLGRIKRATVAIPSGDYQVVGRRAGFRDATLLLSVRAGIAPSVVSVTCTQPASP